MKTSSQAELTFKILSAILPVVSDFIVKALQKEESEK